jgi:hypothetical protein
MAVFWFDIVFISFFPVLGAFVGISRVFRDPELFFALFELMLHATVLIFVAHLGPKIKNQKY